MENNEKIYKVVLTLLKVIIVLLIVILGYVIYHKFIIKDDKFSSKSTTNIIYIDTTKRI